MSSSLLNVITYYQRSIEKSSHDEKRLLHCIEKLYKLPIKLEHLQSTGVGKTVNSLRKYDKEVGVAAKALVAKWKAMVASEAQVAEDEEDEDIKPSSHDDDNNDNSRANNNTPTDTQNNMLHEEHHSVHSKHNGRSSYTSKDRNQNVHDSSSKVKSHDRKSHSSSRRNHGESRSDKYSSSSSKECDRRKLEKYAGQQRNKSKGSDSDGQENERNFQLSVVQAIQEDFEVIDDDDDDEEKLIIDVSKEKTEEVDKKSKFDSQSSSKHRHHSNRDSSKRDSRRQKGDHYSKDKSSKESNHNKESSKKESKHSREDLKKQHNSRDQSSKSGSDHSKKDISQRDDNRTESDNSHSKENSYQETSHSKVKDNERSLEKKDIKEEPYKSEEIHKFKRSESIDKESNKKDREKHSSSSHRSNGEHYKSKHKDKEREKDKGKEKNSTDLKRKNSDSESKSSEGSPTKAKIPKILVDGIDSSMGTSFEDALGMISVSSSSKGTPKTFKTSPKVTASTSSLPTVFVKPSSRSPKRSKTPPLLTSAIKLEPLDPSIALELPTISPNYKPLPLNPIVMECVFSTNKPQQTDKIRRLMTDEEAMSSGISSKTVRTKVYSGIKTGAIHQVLTLFDLCIRVLQKNIDALEYTGGVPFEVLRPVLDRATPQQLIIFEEYNPYLMEDSDVLWQQHCTRYYRSQKRQEMETWREMFLRCKEEQELKLNLLAENIKQSQKQIQLPVRKTQLAYIDSMVKPPRNVLRKQEQYGTKSSVSATPATRVAALSNMTSSASKVGDFRLKAAASAPDTVQIALAAAGSANNGRPKKAPLMQKTIKFMKGRFKR